MAGRLQEQRAELLTLNGKLAESRDQAESANQAKTRFLEPDLAPLPVSRKVPT